MNAIIIIKRTIKKRNVRKNIENLLKFKIQRLKIEVEY